MHIDIHKQQAILFFHYIHQITISLLHLMLRLNSQVWNCPHFLLKIPIMLSGFQVVWCLKCRLCCGCVVVEAGGGVAQVWSLGGRGPQCLQSAVWRQSLVTTTPWARQHGPHYTSLLFGFSKYKTENILTFDIQNKMTFF